MVSRQCWIFAICDHARVSDQQSTQDPARFPKQAPCPSTVTIHVHDVGMQTLSSVDNAPTRLLRVVIILSRACIDWHYSMYVRTHVCMYVCMYVRMYVCMYVCLFHCLYACMYLCICVKICFCALQANVCKSVPECPIVSEHANEPAGM